MVSSFNIRTVFSHAIKYYSTTSFEFMVFVYVCMCYTSSLRYKTYNIFLLVNEGIVHAKDLENNHVTIKKKITTLKPVKTTDNLFDYLYHIFK